MTKKIKTSKNGKTVKKTKQASDPMCDGHTQLTEKELKTLADVLAVFESGVVKETGVRHISGGFATADMFNYDDDAIDIELKWGVQSDCQDDVHTESYKLDRSVLSDETKNVSKMVEDIESC